MGGAGNGSENGSVMPHLSSAVYEILKRVLVWI